MNEGGSLRPKLPFASEKDSNKFFREVVKLLIKEFDNRRKKYVPTSNFQVFYHGRSWDFQRQEEDGYKPHSGELKKESTGCEIKLERILKNDIGVLTDFIRETAGKMEQQLFQRLSAEMIAVTKETGNEVSVAKEGSIADAFLKMVKTTQMGVTAEGKVSRPTLFLNDPSFIEKLQQEIIERGPEFLQEIELARSEQEQKALEREAERLARFDQTE